MVAAKEPVAFLGMGTMGHAMASTALRAGVPTVVWNRDPLQSRGPRRTRGNGRRHTR